MKVLQINSVCGYGSTGRIVVSLYNELINTDSECLIAYGRKDEPLGYNTYKIGNKLDNYMHVFKTRIFDKHGLGSKKATLELIKKIKEYNPDIIHLHNVHGYYINLIILFEFLKQYEKPIVWTLHDCWAFTGHCAHFTKSKCDKWKSKCKNCVEKNSYPSSIMKDNSTNNYIIKKNLFTKLKNVTIVTPSKWLANLVKESFLKEYDVKVINNGIDLDLFKFKQNDFKIKNKIEDKFLILGVASQWDERKGLSYFLDLNEKLDGRFKIVLVGLTEKQKNNLPKKILGITRTNNIDELAKIYSAADVFVNPTLEDNFPTTNLEAMACGTPVITFNTGGSGESITSLTGFVVEYGDINSIISILNNLEFKKIKSKDCEDRAMLYSDKLKFKDYIKLYNDLLKCKGKKYE